MATRKPAKKRKPTKARKPAKRPRKSSGGRRSRKKRRRSTSGALRKLASVTLLAGVVFALGAYVYFSRGLPSVDALRNYEPPQTTRVYDRHGEVIGEIFNERRTVIALEEIPRHVVLAVLAAEDADFYEHEGLDYKGILRAILADLVAGRAKQGGSTITQQVVKLNLLSPERTLSRKVKELILAKRLEAELSKDEILHLYLNHVNFGHGRYGIQEAAQYYFGKNASGLSLAEATMLAGIPQAPARLSPRSHPERAERRQKYVLAQLSAKREVYWPDLSEKDIEAARKEEVELVPVSQTASRAPEILAIARKTLREAVGPEALARGGYEIYTTIDLTLQEQSREALQEGLRAVDRRQGYRGPYRKSRRGPKASKRSERLRMGRTYVATVTATDDGARRIDLDVAGHRAVLRMDSVERHNPKNLAASKLVKKGDLLPVSIIHPAQDEDPAVARLERGPEGAVVVIDPRSRDVLALVGGYAAKSGFNRATSAVRQPGSTFKPIVYARAIQTRKFTPATLVVDAPAVYNEWKPRNYEQWSYRGAVRLREALAASINMVAVRVVEDLGVPDVANFARQLGISTKLDEDMTLALGASGVKPIELTNAYATFAAGGRWAPPRIIERIVAPDGSKVPLERPEPARDVMTPDEAYVVTSMLESVVTEGTGAAAQRLQRPLGGKTGTSNRARDAWFVGYSPSVVAGVWVGFDDSRPLGRKENGTRTALPIWIDVMAKADGPQSNAAFAVPSGVLRAEIDPASGLLAYAGQEDAVAEVFLTGTAPVDVARPPDVADPNAYLMEQYDDSAEALAGGGDEAKDRVLGGMAPP